jgi:hypothetical protein
MQRICGIGLLCLGSAWAQESINYASISGRVTDPTGAVILGAQVTARQVETNLAAIAETDRDGRFRFPYLKVGQYAIAVHQQGFADLTRAVTLSVGAAFELPISLAVGAANPMSPSAARRRFWRRRAVRSPARCPKPRSPVCRSTDEIFSISPC